MSARDALPQDPEALLAHVEWARRLARRLVVDVHQAEDVAQEAWLAAARQAPREGIDPRAWLGRVLQNAALQLRRRETARAARERRAAADRTFSPSDEELRQSVDAHRRLAACVMHLEEPYRRAVILRYWRDLSPRAIAAQERVPVATVKTRLRRALARLRKSLSREYGAEGRNWLPALATLGAPKLGAISIGGVLVAKKTLLAASILLALGILGAIWTLRPERPPASVASLSPRAEPTMPAGAALPSASEATEVAVDGNTIAREIDDGVDSGGPTIAVVDGSSGAPLEGAEVWLMPYALVTSHQWMSYRGDRYDPEPDAQELGLRRETDSAGGIRVADLEEAMLAVGRRDDLFGAVWISDDAAHADLRLWKDRTLTILVVDRSGEPQSGVPVALRTSGGNVYWQKETDEEGLARMCHVGTEWYGFLAVGENYHAALSFPLAEPVKSLVDPEAFPVEPVRLELPATGSVTIELRDAQGAPHLMGNWVNLQHLTRSASEPSRTEYGERFGECLFEDYRVVFPHVGLGLELEASAANFGIFKRCTQRVMGPVEPGESVHVNLDVGATHAYFSARLVDPSGEPLPNMVLAVATVTCLGEEGEPIRAGSGAVIYGGGEIQIALDESIPAGRPCTLAFQTPAYMGQVLRGEYEAIAPAPGEEEKCGDLVLRSSPRAVRGRVVDEQGAPVHDAWISAGRKYVFQPPSVEYRWDHEAGLPGSRTDRDGYFEMWGDLQPGEYALWSKKKGYINSGWVPFDLGASDVELVLARGATVAGTMLADDGFPLERLSVAVEQLSDDTAELGLLSFSQVRPSGSYRLENLRPGPARLRVHSGEHSQPFHVVDAIELTGGECPDARVRTIDLRDRVHVHEIEVVDPAGDPVRSGRVIIRPGEMDEESRVYGLEAGRATWISCARAVDVEIRVAGFRDVSVPGVTGPRRIVLEQGIPVTLRLPPDVELPPPPWVLDVELAAVRSDEDEPRHVYSSDSRGRLDWSAGRVDPHAAFGPDRSLTLCVPFEARYDLRWMLYDPGDLRRGGSTRPTSSAIEHLDIGPSAAAFEVRPDPADYERVLGTVR